MVGVIRNVASSIYHVEIAVEDGFIHAICIDSGSDKLFILKNMTSNEFYETHLKDSLQKTNVEVVNFITRKHLIVDDESFIMSSDFAPLFYSSCDDWLEVQYN